MRDDGDFRRTVIESERLEKEYAHYFDSRIVNNDFEQTFQRLLRNVWLLPLGIFSKNPRDSALNSKLRIDQKLWTENYGSYYKPI